jgi:nitroimidazol reductase NimA-like FMN-containing flavoprotein (pyridoxamine 5'-phosphate oxidase superfamily)
MFGTLNTEQIEIVLKFHMVGRLGCHADGITYIVPISYAYEDNTIYIHTQEGMKVDLLRKNPEICFQVDDLGDMSNWKSVIAWGRFEEINEEEERTKAIKHLTHRVFPVRVSRTVHLTSEWPFETGVTSHIEGIIGRITLSKKTGRYENDMEHPPLSYSIH